MNTKTEKYQKLINDFKTVENLGETLKNPFYIIHENPNNGVIREFNHINPISVWQHNLDAKILVVGQDWGPETDFIKYGKDKDDNGFVKKISTLFKSINIEIGSPSNPIPQSIFFTNIVLGIRNGDNYSGTFNSDWIQPSTKYLDELIGIIDPKIILCLGSYASNYIFKKYDLKFKNLKASLSLNPIEVNNRLIFSLYHPSTRALNRTDNEQLEDWKKIIPHL